MLRGTYPTVLETVLPFKHSSGISPMNVILVPIDFGFGTSRFSRCTRRTRISMVPRPLICASERLVSADSSDVVLGLI